MLQATHIHTKQPTNHTGRDACCDGNRPALAENVAIVNALAELKQLHAMFSGIVDPSCEPNPEPPSMAP